MDFYGFLSTGRKKGGHCEEVAISKGSTVVPRADKPVISPSLYPMPSPLSFGSLLLSLSLMGYGEEMAEISDKLNPHPVRHLVAAWLNG